MEGEIQAILFDAGNTLVSLDRARTLAIFREFGVEVDEDRMLRAELASRITLDRSVGPGSPGTEPKVWKKYLATLFRESGIPERLLEDVGRRVVEEHEASHLWTHVEEDTPRTLQLLLDRGYRLGVVSNADGRMESVLEMAGIRTYFEFVMDSHEVGLEKPDPRIFREACRQLGARPDGCLYVGDLYPVDVVGAHRAGLRAVLLDPTGALRHPVDRIASVAELPGYLEELARHSVA